MNKLTQKKIDKLDKIGKECGFELHMPPFKRQHYPFFVMDGLSAVDKKRRSMLLETLDDSKFHYTFISNKCILGRTSSGNESGIYLLIKG